MVKKAVGLMVPIGFSVILMRMAILMNVIVLVISQICVRSARTKDYGIMVLKTFSSILNQVTLLTSHVAVIVIAIRTSDHERTL